MTRTITTAFLSPDTSANSNLRAVGIVRPGRYSGYVVSPTAGAAYRLDLTHSSVGVLVMPNGLRVQDDQDLVGELIVTPGDASRYRMDAVIARVVGVETVVFSVVAGVYPAEGASPGNPVVPDDAALLGYVSVPPLSVSTALRAQDMRPAPVASWSPTETLSDCLPELASDGIRIYVYPGTFISVDGRSPINFGGAYSEPIPIGDYAVGEVRYVRFALTDAGAVIPVASAATEALLPDLTNDVFPVAHVRTTRAFSAITLSELRDIRFVFDRNQANIDEERSFRELLSDSVFSSMRTDMLVDQSLIQLATVAGAAATISTEDTALTLVYGGPALVPTADVTIATGDLLAGGTTPAVRHFMLVTRAPTDGLRFQYSTSGSTGGFTTATYRPGEIVRIAQGEAAHLYVRFLFPPQAFQASKTAKLYAYAVLMNLDPGALNAATIGELGVPALSANTNNLLNNADFAQWSRPDVNGLYVDPLTTVDSVFRVGNSAGGPNGADVQKNLADGWQMSATTTVDSQTVTRTADQWLRLTTSPGAGTVYVEQRMQNAVWLRGQGVTMSLDFVAGAPGVVGIGVAVYERTANQLILRDTYKVLTADSAGSPVVQTPPIPTYASELGFFVFYQDIGSAVTCSIARARVAVGLFGTLPYSPGGDPAELYQKGRTVLSANGEAGSPLAVSSTLRAPQLGTVVARVLPGGLNLTSGVANVALTHDGTSVLVSAAATVTGPASLYVEWEAYVDYQSSPA